MICELCKQVKPDFGNKKYCRECWMDLHNYKEEDFHDYEESEYDDDEF